MWLFDCNTSDSKPLQDSNYFGCDLIYAHNKRMPSVLLALAAFKRHDLVKSMSHVGALQLLCRLLPLNCV